MCHKEFASNQHLTEHKQSHLSENNKTEYKCTKCDKVYCDMRKLRRHDWRNHRSIECSICAQVLESRQAILNHRQMVHYMNRKQPCKYFPDCYDGDECLFAHESSVNPDDVSAFCSRGEDCSDQSCLFNEQQHKSVIKNCGIKCKFQANCYRFGCPYKHDVSRSAFLGESISRNRRT